MRKYNINNPMYIQITDEGWKHLEKTVGLDYINNCIKTPYNEKLINGEIWYVMECWNVFNLLPTSQGRKLLFKTEVMFDE